MGGAVEHPSASFRRRITREPLEVIKKKILRGRLPAISCKKTWYGKGKGQPCDGCDQPVSGRQIEVEADFGDTLILRFHSACFDISQTRSQRPQTGVRLPRRYTSH